jgi:uncharacterized membrane protein YphA (DoxX/SURF4 family)
MSNTALSDTKLPAGETAGRNALTRYLPPVARVLMGLMFFVFGLNGFLHFMPTPKDMPEAAMAFFGALMKTGYMLPLISETQVIVGALLLSNRFVPLALALIAPVIVNIVAFHAFVQPTGAVMAGVVLVLELYLAWAYRGAYRPMLAMRVQPGAAAN